MPLADLGGHADVEGLLVCLLLVGLVSVSIYLVVTHGFKQAWGGLAAGITFVVGALLCIL